MPACPAKKSGCVGPLPSIPVFFFSANVRYSLQHNTRDCDGAFLRSPAGPARSSNGSSPSSRASRRRDTNPFSRGAPLRHRLLDKPEALGYSEIRWDADIPSRRQPLVSCERITNLLQSKLPIQLRGLRPPPPSPSGQARSLRREAYEAIFPSSCAPLHCRLLASRQWPEVSDSVARFCTLQESENTRTCEKNTRHTCISHMCHDVRVFSDSRNLQKSVTQIIYLGPLPTGQARSWRREAYKAILIPLRVHETVLDLLLIRLVYYSSYLSREERSVMSCRRILAFHCWRFWNWRWRRNIWQCCPLSLAELLFDWGVLASYIKKNYASLW